MAPKDETALTRLAARLRIAHALQEGAVNPRPIIDQLKQAVTDCYTDGIAPNRDPAVWLILHQLFFVLTGWDATLPGADVDLEQRWSEANEQAKGALGEDDSPELRATLAKLTGRPA